MSTIDTIYIDSADEITTVIERLKRAHAPIVAIVVPKGALLLQSIVNLKLAKKAALDSEKDLILVTTDKIGRNLATQIGLAVAANEKEVPKVASGELEEEEGDAKVIAGVRIHRYYAEDEAEISEEEATAEPAPAANEVQPTSARVIVPKELLKKEDQPMPAGEVPVEPVMEPVAEATTEAAEEAPTEPMPAAEAPVEPVAAPAIEEITPITRRKVSVEEPMVEEVAPAAKDPAAKIVPVTTATEKPGRRSRVPLVIISVLIVLLLAFLGAYFVLPSTTVTLHAQAKAWQQDVTLTATTTITSISADNTTVPAELLSADASVTTTVTATGTKQVGDAATGTVTLYNLYSTTTQTVPSGTKISANGQVFSTQAAVVVPGFTQSDPSHRTAGTNSVAITADVPGVAGNLSGATASDITSNGDNLSAKVDTSGGTDKQVPVIQAADITSARTGAETQLRQALVQKLTDQLTNRDVIIPAGTDTVTFGDFTTTDPVGAQVASTQATYKGTIQRLVIDKANVVTAVSTSFANKTLADGVLKIDAPNPGAATLVAGSKTSATVPLHLTGKITPVLTTQGLLPQLEGRSIESAQTLAIQLTGASSVSIQQHPAWWPFKRVPSVIRFLKLETVYE